MNADAQRKHKATVAEMIAKLDDVLEVVNERLEPLRTAGETDAAMWTVLSLMANTGLVLTMLADTVELPERRTKPRGKARPLL